MSIETDDLPTRGAGRFHAVQTVGSSGGISIELWREQATGKTMLVVFPTTEGFTVLMSGLEDESDLGVSMSIKMGEIILRTLRVTTPLVSGQHFRTP